MNDGTPISVPGAGEIPAETHPRAPKVASLNNGARFTHSPAAAGATRPDHFVSAAGADANPMVPGEIPGRLHPPGPVDGGAHETGLVVSGRRGGTLGLPAPAVAALNQDTPAGDPEFDRLPMSERQRVVWRLMLMRRLDQSSSKLAFLRAFPLPPEKGASIKALLNLHTTWATGAGAVGPRDWRLLVDRRRARALVVAAPAPRYSREFIEAVQGLFVENKRKTAPAIRKLHEWWYTGQRLLSGRLVNCPVPGYGTAQLGPRGERPPLPSGWSDSNLRRLCRLTPAQLALAREGIAAARRHTPHILTTRANLRWLEFVMFDDVKLDFRVLDATTGQVCDLWLLVAMDWASACALGFWMRPALARDDGSQEHLRSQDMLQFCGWLLERYGLPVSYSCTWKLENGTATIEEGLAAALPGLFGDRLRASFARMVGGASPVGYGERAKGNSQAKAPLESFFNPLHNFLADVPGQTGRRYDVRPADLAAREAEARRIWEAAQRPGMDEELAGQVQYPLLTVAQARPVVNRAFRALNARTNHDIEGFLEIVEPVYGVPGQFAKRFESPFERAARLAQSNATQRVPEVAIGLLYRSTHRLVRVDSKGEIELTIAGRKCTYQSPAGHTLAPGTKLVGCYCDQDPTVIYLSLPEPHCGFVGAWLRRERIDMADRDAVAEQFHRTQAAMRAEQDAVAALAAPERAALEAMRVANDTIFREAADRREAIDATPLAGLTDAAAQELAPGPVAAAIGAARNSMRRSGKERVENQAQREDLAALADEALERRFS